MAKILHTADVHLQQVGDQRWQALVTILETAAKLKVDGVTIAGDLFDQDAHSHELRDKLRTLFSQLNYQIIILPGNHDARSFEAGLYFGDNVTLLTDSSQVIKLKDASITGIPFEPLSAGELFKKIEVINDQLDQDDHNILLFHGELTDLFFNSSDFGDEGQKRYLPLKLNLLTQTKFDYILAGHFHSKLHIKRLPNRRMQQGGYFIYPGSPVSITTKETGPRSVALIQTQRAPQPIALATVYYELFELTVKPSADQKLISKIEKELQQLPDNARGILKITGFYDQKKLGLTEQEFKTTLDKLAKKYHSHLDANNFTVKDVGSIISSGLYQTFAEHLKQTEFSDAYQQQLSQQFINALMQVNS